MNLNLINNISLGLNLKIYPCIFMLTIHAIYSMIKIKGWSYVQTKHIIKLKILIFKRGKSKSRKVIKE